MTSDIVIRAEGLGKKYIIGHQSADRSNTFRDVITQNVKNFIRGARDMAQGKAIIAGDELEEFWALKDVDFEIKRGDVVGIIGRNGAGKSTLLKVLSRITEPTEGRVEINGRVASLLEVGTGFHPELSGRENVYLNGAILGMTRAEINRKFDEIVDFSGVEKFLDTPVKRYSSGMYVRLAFAVAAHLEPEILIVDEVLAVGDSEFQKKCLGKMQDVAGQGRTVLFVSHNMAAVQRLCNLCVVMASGKILMQDDTKLSIQHYLSSRDDSETIWEADGLKGYSNNFFTPLKIIYEDGRLFLTGTLRGLADNLLLGFSFETQDEQLLFWTHHKDTGLKFTEDMIGKQIELSFEIPTATLNTGKYTARFSAMLHNQEYIIKPEDGPSISLVIEDPLDRHSDFEQPRPGLLAPEIQWQARVL